MLPIEAREPGSPRIHYVDQREYLRLLVSRRRLERVWGRRGTPAEQRAVVRDARTGELYAVMSTQGVLRRESAPDFRASS